MYISNPYEKLNFSEDQKVSIKLSTSLFDYSIISLQVQQIGSVLQRSSLKMLEQISQNTSQPKLQFCFYGRKIACTRCAFHKLSYFMEVVWYGFLSPK